MREPMRGDFFAPDPMSPIISLTSVAARGNLSLVLCMPPRRLDTCILLLMIRWAAATPRGVSS